MEKLTPVGREAIIIILRQFEHKVGVDTADWYKVHDNLIVLAAFTVKFAKENYLPLKFTSIIRPKIKGVSKTDIHSKGRAFDISVIGWKKEKILEFVDLINKEFKLGAISITDGKEREGVFEDAEFDKDGKQTKWPHLHVQCRP
jgi:hypothetical protein